MPPVKLKHMPIRYKLIVLFILVSIVPSILLGGLISFAVSDTIEKQINTNTLQLIDNVNKSLETFVNEMQNTTYMISFNPDITAFLDHSTSDLAEAAQTEQMYRMKKFLQGFTTLHSEIAGILVASDKGDYISNDMYPRSSGKLTDESWYKEAEAGRGIFRLLGHPHNRGISNHVNYKDEELVTAVRAILDPATQKVKGVVLIDLKPRVIAETVRDVRLGKSGYLMVTDGNGESIYTPPHPVLTGIPKEWLGDSNSGVISESVNNNHFQLIYRKSDFTGWTTIGVFPMWETANDISKISFYIVCFIFFVCMVGLGLSYYLSVTITKPIWKLMALMQKVETGNLTIRYTGHHDDEVGILGRAFNVMLTQINKLIKEVASKEQQKREAELRNLHAQIKPHFLYNTLDTIHWLAHQRGANEITEVVDSLSTLFRIGLSKGKEIIPLFQEIEHVRSYLKIQKTRYRSKLDYTIDIPPEAEGLYVMKLIVQPIVENAIYHGIKERRGPGCIRITGEVRDGKVLLHIRDDGKGMDERTLAALRNSLESVKQAIVRQAENQEHRQTETGVVPAASEGGYGLLNVQSRLVLTFGEACGLAVESEPGKGTLVTIVHPYMKEMHLEVLDHESVEGRNSG
ncbi:sensor histidine kinase [Paenibacillus sp. P25]|nr:sensor histidine kinase [Paenibacillus sp. P25]